MAGGVDLHTHTIASDGTLRPGELVVAAARRGVRVLAVTDHDSTDGLAEAIETARRHPPLTIVPGIEINCDVEGAEIHILGYYMDYEAAWFQDFCRAQREERRARVHRTAERLAALGMPIDVERVFALVQEGAAGRPHVARVMLERGYVKTVREAFDKYLAAGKPAHVPRKKLTPEDAVRLLRRAGGVPVFAHPGLSDRDELIRPGRRRARWRRCLPSIRAQRAPSRRLPGRGLVATAAPASTAPGARRGTGRPTGAGGGEPSGPRRRRRALLPRLKGQPAVREHAPGSRSVRERKKVIWRVE
jgi:predicted metal-dependent phosphoesterase TrpH